MKRYELIEKIKLITSCTESCAEDVLDIFLEEPEHHIRSPDDSIQIDTIIRLKKYDLKTVILDLHN